MNKSKPKLKGFTLLELIIVIAIIAIMAAVLVPNVLSYIRTSQIQAANTQAQQIYMAAQDYLTSLQVKGVKPSDIADSTTTKVCWIMVTSDIAADSTKADNNRTVVPFSSGIKSDYIQKVNADLKVAFPIADGIEARLDGSFNGSWVIAFYPKTFTVAYAVYNGKLSDEADRNNAVYLIGTNSGKSGANVAQCNDRLYTTEFGSAASTEKCQELDIIHHPVSGEPIHDYTGQYPIPGPAF
ncbi:prepilin-type N-terminal cleavage/methylation domain-containing protein [Huintestinicola sp.]|uniref:prepilin-type N-terminal cleavage/methylation domain-containing protein n=1 Tax=Huintestinicola sp. TaxID=2981661 RepID=UPI003D7CC982